jgi:hypothetical protein
VADHGADARKFTAARHDESFPVKSQNADLGPREGASIVMMAAGVKPRLFGVAAAAPVRTSGRSAGRRLDPLEMRGR